MIGTLMQGVSSEPRTDLLVELNVMIDRISSIRNFIQLNVKDVEDKTVKRRTESITQSPNPCDHTLSYTYTHTLYIVTHTYYIHVWIKSTQGSVCVCGR